MIKRGGALSERKCADLRPHWYQRVRSIERSEFPQKLHVRLHQGRWLIEVRPIADHCCSGVNEPAFL